MKLRFVKVKDVKSPAKGHTTDAGIDFFMPKGSGCVIPAHETFMIPSGIKCNIPTGYALIAFDKSGVGAKKKLKVMAGVIDEGYQGEIHICLLNTTDKEVEILEDEKIIQFLLVPVPEVKIEEANSEKDLFPEETSRGDGRFGSTGQF